MKTIQFEKYQGTGNDFVMIDNRNGFFDKNNISLVQAMCHQKFGIGADGLILIENHAESDFECIYFNADGSQSLCGNGSRCAVNFAQSLGIISDKTTFLAIDGLHEAFRDERKYVHLKMNPVKDFTQKDSVFFMNTGSPHHIEFVNNIENFPVFEKGKEIRYSSQYANGGTNVNFAQKKEDFFFVRTYERGVENETLSCGTGVTAVGLAVATMGFESPVKIKTLGGNLEIHFQKEGEHEFKNIYLVGPAEKVFEGVWLVK